MGRIQHSKDRKCSTVQVFQLALRVVSNAMQYEQGGLPAKIKKKITKASPNKPLSIDNLLANGILARRTSPSDDEILDSIEVASLPLSRSNLTNLDSESQSSLNDTSQRFVTHQLHRPLSL